MMVAIAVSTEAWSLIHLDCEQANAVRMRVPLEVLDGLAVAVGLGCEPQPYLRHLQQDHLAGRIQILRDFEAELRTHAIIVRAATPQHLSLSICRLPAPDLPWDLNAANAQ